MIDQIGRKIRDLRIAAELTQSELGQRAGLTDGFISQMERGLTSISIDSLKMILDALNVSLFEFFKEGKNERIVFGTADRTVLDEGGTATLTSLVPGAANRDMEPALLNVPPGASTSLRPSFQGDCFGFVLRGAVKLEYGTENYRVRRGESFYFTAECEHRVSNPYKRAAEVLWIISPPYF